MKGSMTVEAAYLFPFCFFFIAAVCYLGIFLYDQAVLKLTVYECILQTADAETVSEKTLEQMIEEKGAERMLAAEQPETKIRITGTKIHVSCRAEQTVFKLPIEAEISYERVYPELTLRFMRKRK